MQRPFRHFRRVHLSLFVGFYLAFAAMTLFALASGSESDRRGNHIAAATLGVVSGPFTGAIARQFQSCCWQFSLSLLPWCALSLGVGALFQFVPLPFRRFERATRVASWCLGLLGWFGGALLSFLLALS